jgi:predicted O-methyltransferase YrrM
MYNRAVMKDRIDAILRRQQAEYLDSLVPSRDELLAEMEHFAAENNHPIADPEVAQFIRMIVRLQQPKRIVEVGTNIGYSVIVMGRELPRDAKIETIELNRSILETAKSFVTRASLKCQVDFLEGAALEVLPTMPPGVDLAFIDCVKTEYPDYLCELLPKMNRGGVIVADNVLWKGQVAEGAMKPSEEASTAKLRDFNRILTTDSRFLTSVLPVGDGLSFTIVS